MSRNPQVTDLTEIGDNVYRDIHAERIRAHEKHGANGNSRENAEAMDPEWLPILGEEFGEVCRWFTYDSERDISELRDELIQVAAMSAAWIESIDEMIEGTTEESESE